MLDPPRKKKTNQTQKSARENTNNTGTSLHFTPNIEKKEKKQKTHKKNWFMSLMYEKQEKQIVYYSHQWYVVGTAVVRLFGTLHVAYKYR